MIFDLGIWPLTTWTYKGSHIASINQVWFQSDSKFTNEATFIFSAYLTAWPQVTFDLDVTFDLINKWGVPCCIYDPALAKIHQSMWTVELNVNQLPVFKITTTDNNNSEQSDPYVSFLLRQATQKSRVGLRDLQFLKLMIICCLFCFKKSTYIRNTNTNFLKYILEISDYSVEEVKTDSQSKKVLLTWELLKRNTVSWSLWEELVNWRSIGQKPP